MPPRCGKRIPISALAALAHYVSTARPETIDVGGRIIPCDFPILIAA